MAHALPILAPIAKLRYDSSGGVHVRPRHDEILILRELVHQRVKVPSGEVVESLGPGAGKRVAFAPDGGRLARSMMIASVEVHDLALPGSAAVWERSPDNAMQATTALAFDPESGALLQGASEGAVASWDASGKPGKKEMRKSKKSVSDLIPLSLGRALVLGQFDKAAHILDLTKRKVLRTFETGVKLRGARVDRERTCLLLFARDRQFIAPLEGPESSVEAAVCAELTIEDAVLVGPTPTLVAIDGAGLVAIDARTGTERRRVELPGRVTDPMLNTSAIDVVADDRLLVLYRTSATSAGGAIEVRNADLDLVARYVADGPLVGAHLTDSGLLLAADEDHVTVLDGRLALGR